MCMAGESRLVRLAGRVQVCWREAGQVSLCRGCREQGEGTPQRPECASLPVLLCSSPPHTTTPPCREVFIVAQVEKEFSYSARNRVQLWEGGGERSVLPPDGLVARISFR